MTEEHNKDKYIICSGCKSKYINDEEHISKDFGYTRLEERYKTCVKCRASHKIRSKKHHENHKEELNEYSKKYRDERKEERKLYDKERYKIKNKCPNCDSEVCKKELPKHQRTVKCKSIAESKNKQILSVK